MSTIVTGGLRIQSGAEPVYILVTGCPARFRFWTSSTSCAVNSTFAHIRVFPVFRDRIKHLTSEGSYAVPRVIQIA
jgi:hypothetical protein